MKKPLLFILMIIGVFSLKAQSPQAFSYQAIVRNSDGELVSNSSIGMKISIVQGSVNGDVVYEETHDPSTNTNGLVTIQVGQGSIESGTFNDIAWGHDDYFIKSEIDPEGGSNYSISGTTQLLSVPYALYSANAPSYKIGDFAHGGIVFWVDKTGQHGLVCAKDDQSTAIRWHAGSAGVTNAIGNGSFSGKMNTAIILSSLISIGDDGNPYAAKVCAGLEITEDGETYGDWYLPSSSELQLMFDAKSEINATAAANSGSALREGNYWSSTEVSSSNALFVDMTDGSDGPEFKNLSFGRGVRAVRSF